MSDHCYETLEAAGYLVLDEEEADAVLGFVEALDGWEFGTEQFPLKKYLLAHTVLKPWLRTARSDDAND